MRFHLASYVAMSAIAFSLPFDALSQSNPFNGTWHATFKLRNGVARDGTVIVDNNGGSWDMNIQSQNDPCVGRKFPISVQKANADELVFVVEGSKALAGCRDTELNFKAIDGATLTATAANGIEFTLKKK